MATDEAVEAVVAVLRGAGRNVLNALPIAPPPGEAGRGRKASTDGTVVLVRVRDAADAAVALRLAMDGHGVVLLAEAGRDLLDALYDDLRRLGPLTVRTRPGALPLEGLAPDERALLVLLANGRSLGDAAKALHLSRRTADRRLAAARRALGVATTAEAIARLRSGA